MRTPELGSLSGRWAVIVGAPTNAELAVLKFPRPHEKPPRAELAGQAASAHLQLGRGPGRGAYHHGVWRLAA